MRAGVFIGEQDVTTSWPIQRNIGLSSRIYALFPHLTVFENVDLRACASKRMAESEIGTAVHDVLQMVCLAGYDRQFPTSCPRRANSAWALARATVIAARPALRRAVVESGRELRVHMRRELQAVAETALHHRRVRHARPGKGDGHLGPDRGDEPGAIAQEGTAESLYRQPASEFVAQFIGRTNLLTARV